MSVSTNQIPLSSSRVTDYTYCKNGKRDTNYGILLSVSLLGLSSISTVSMSAIISCWLILTVRRCLLWPSAAVSPGWLKELQPKGIKTKTNKIIVKFALNKDIETLFAISPYFQPAGIYAVLSAQTPLIINLLYRPC